MRNKSCCSKRSSLIQNTRSQSNSALYAAFNNAAYLSIRFYGHSIGHSVLDNGRPLDRCPSDQFSSKYFALSHGPRGPYSMTELTSVGTKLVRLRWPTWPHVESTRICWQFALCAAAVAHSRTNYATGFCHLWRVGPVLMRWMERYGNRPSSEFAGPDR